MKVSFLFCIDCLELQQWAPLYFWGSHKVFHCPSPSSTYFAFGNHPYSMWFLAELSVKVPHPLLVKHMTQTQPIRAPCPLACDWLKVRHVTEDGSLSVLWELLLQSQERPSLSVGLVVLERWGLGLWDDSNSWLFCFPLASLLGCPSMLLQMAKQHSFLMAE